MVDLTGYKLTFDDEFNSRSISDTGAGTTWGDIRSQWRYDAYSDIGFGKSSFMDAGSGYDPFSVSNGTLSITASPDTTKYGYKGSWESGLITSKDSFSQTYGYFEIRADFCDVLGAWDAFWMLPEKAAVTGKSGWQELDVVEHYGSDPNGAYSTIHSTDSLPAPGAYANRANLSAGFHTYGMDWEKDQIRFYVDGVLTGTKATPSDMHGPMYLLADLATRSYVGATGAPMTSKIDYIRAFSKDAAAQAIALDKVSSPDGQDPGLYGATSLGPSVSITAQTLADDIGASAADRATTDGRVTLTGTATGAAGTIVTVYDGTTALGLATFGAAGVWSFATTLKAGIHALSATATDPNGVVAASATQPAITVESTASSSAAKALDVLTLRVAEDAFRGDAQFTVSVDGAQVGGVQTVTALNRFGQTQDITLQGNFGTGTHTVGVNFLNDLSQRGPGGGDRNLRVKSIALDGQVTQANRVQWSSGLATYTVATPVTAPDLLVLKMSEDAFAGDAQFAVTVDGRAVGGAQTVTASHASGASQEFVLSGYFGTGTHTVGIDYLNALHGKSAATNRSLYVQSVALDGQEQTVGAAQTAKGVARYQVHASTSVGDAQGGLGATVASGSTLILDGAAGAGAAVTFAGRGGTLQLTDATSFHGSIAGLAAGDAIDLRSIGFGSGTHLSYTGDATGGTLSVSDGTHAASLALTGAYQASAFHLSSDTHQGVLVGLSA